MTIEEARAEFLTNIKTQITASEAHLAALPADGPKYHQQYYLVTLDGTAVLSQGQPLMGQEMKKLWPAEQDTLSLRPINPSVSAVGLPLSWARAEVAATRWNAALTPEQRQSCTVQVRTERQAEEQRLVFLKEMQADLEGGAK